MLLVTSPFHQLRSRLVFLQVLQEQGLHTVQVGVMHACWRPTRALSHTNAVPCCSLQLSVAESPFVGHKGFGPWLDHWLDYWDLSRELAAIVYYKLLHYI